MKTLTFLLSLATSLSASAFPTCQELQVHENQLQPMGEETVLTLENWKTLDVVAQFNRRQCLRSFEQVTTRFQGQILRLIRSNDHSCDGGRTFGVIYDEALRTPLAHIYNGKIVCQDQWRPDYRAENHRCDLSAENFAQEKMKALGLELVETTSTVEVRELSPYIHVQITGTVLLSKNKTARVEVYGHLEGCQWMGATLKDLPL